MCPNYHGLNNEIFVIKTEIHEIRRRNVDVFLPLRSEPGSRHSKCIFITENSNEFHCSEQCFEMATGTHILF